jgi:hypothetical protein
MAEHQYADFIIWGLACFSGVTANPRIAVGEHPYSLFCKPHNEDFKQLTGKNTSISTSTRVGTEW